MGNLSQQLTTHKARISLDPAQIKNDLIHLISFDLDFTENEDYFRSDTLSLGYENEAERLVDEYLKEFKVENKTDLFECCSSLLGMVFDSSFYGDWTLEIANSKKENEFIVFCSYIS